MCFPLILLTRFGILILSMVCRIDHTIWFANGRFSGSISVVRYIDIFTHNKGKMSPDKWTGLCLRADRKKISQSALKNDFYYSSNISNRHLEQSYHFPIWTKFNKLEQQGHTRCCVPCPDLISCCCKRLRIPFSGGYWWRRLCPHPYPIHIAGVMGNCSPERSAFVAMTATRTCLAGISWIHLNHVGTPFVSPTQNPSFSNPIRQWRGIYYPIFCFSCF